LWRARGAWCQRTEGLAQAFMRRAPSGVFLIPRTEQCWPRFEFAFQVSRRVTRRIFLTRAVGRGLVEPKGDLVELCL
jgi:hypothetical protein